MKRSAEEAQALLDRLRREKNSDSFYIRLWEELRRALGVDRLGIFVHAAETNELQGIVGTSENGGVENLAGRVNLPIIPRGNTLTVAHRECRPLLFSDVRNDPRIVDRNERAYLSSYGVRAFAAVPLVAGRRAVGVVSMDNLFTQRPLGRATVARAARLCRVLGPLVLERPRGGVTHRSVLEHTLKNYEVAGFGTLVMDHAGRIAQQNDLAKYWLGVVPVRGIHPRFIDLFADRRDRVLLKGLEAAGSVEKISETVLTVRTAKNGGDRYIKIVFAFKTFEGYTAVVFRDVTDQVTLERKLKLQEKKLRAVNATLEERNMVLKRLVDERTADLKTSLLNSIIALSNALEAKDAYTRGHSARVYRCARWMADELGLGREERRILRMGGDLHDIGKIGIPEALLRKPGRLTNQEYSEIRKHPLIGESILRPLGLDARILDIVRHHHERWDGSGYPDGLKGASIPLLTRIVTLADIFDALRSSRCYRGALGLDEMVRLIKADSGRRLDPRLVRLLLNRLRKSGRLGRRSGGGRSARPRKGSS